VVMDQLILFNKPNKNVMSDKKMDHFIPQTKQARKVLAEAGTIYVDTTCTSTSSLT
jgi:hypothetical protein